jgi:hypothetical protein
MYILYIDTMDSHMSSGSLEPHREGSGRSSTADPISWRRAELMVRIKKHKETMFGESNWECLIQLDVFPFFFGKSREINWVDLCERWVNLRVDACLLSGGIWYLINPNELLFIIDCCVSKIGHEMCTHLLPSHLPSPTNRSICIPSAKFRDHRPFFSHGKWAWNNWSKFCNATECRAETNFSSPKSIEIPLDLSIYWP